MTKPTRSRPLMTLMAGLLLATLVSPMAVSPPPAVAASCADPATSRTWSDNCDVSGSSNHSTNLVLAVQYVLHCNGLEPGPRDGIWSPKLQGAVLRFQQDRWPNDTRRWTQRVDRDTWAALNGQVSYTRSAGSRRYYRAGIDCPNERFVRNVKTGVWKVREEPTPAKRQYIPMGTDCGRGDSLKPATAKSIRHEAATIATREKARWAGRSETDPAMRHRLDAYWTCGYGVAQQPSVAWSAAFVSHVMKWADAGSAFDYSANHVSYVAGAKRNRVERDRANPFWAFRPEERAPAVGDLVCKERSNSGVTYDNVDDGTFRASHCDIVVERRADELVIIGGNVGNTVQSPATAAALRENTVPLDGDGRVTDPSVFAVVLIRDRA